MRYELTAKDLYDGHDFCVVFLGFLFSGMPRENLIDIKRRLDNMLFENCPRCKDYVGKCPYCGSLLPGIKTERRAGA